MIFVDTNYFLRHIVDDNGEQHEKAKEFFRDGALGINELFTSTLVIFEIYWVMGRYYKKTVSESCGIIESILEMRFVEIEHRNLLVRALAEAKNGLGLMDNFNLMYARSVGAEKFVTFDVKLHKQWKNMVD